MSAVPADRLRELTFRLEHDPDGDRITTILCQHETLELSTIDIVLGNGSYTRLVQLTGDPDAADSLQTALEDRDYCPRAVDPEVCGGQWSWYRLECSPRRRLIYVYAEDVQLCPSVEALFATILNCGTICESRHCGETVWWRLLMRSDEAVSTLYDRLHGTLEEDVTLEMGHLGTATEWHGDGIVDVGLSGSQREALEAAASRGYYERPREITLEALASDLDVPESTLSYRLRMAESTLVKRHLERFGDGPLA
ncbi:MAG: helix-turn-helix domain-containing protein [Natrinema limicola]